MKGDWKQDFPAAARPVEQDGYVFELQVNVRGVGGQIVPVGLVHVRANTFEQAKELVQAALTVSQAECLPTVYLN